MPDSADDAIVPILRAIQGELSDLRRDVSSIHPRLDEHGTKFNEISDAMSGIMWMLAQNLCRTNDHEDRLDRLEAHKPNDT